MCIRDRSSLSTTEFSNFDNISSNEQCCFCHRSKTQDFYFCNVIDNKVSSGGIFYLSDSATLSVSQCFFKGNNASKLFNIWSGSPTANECHFEDNTFPTNGDIILSSMSMTEIILPNLYSSFLCEIKIRNKKDSIHIPNITFSHLFSDQPSIPPKHSK